MVKESTRTSVLGRQIFPPYEIFFHSLLRLILLPVSLVQESLEEVCKPTPFLLAAALARLFLCKFLSLFSSALIDADKCLLIFNSTQQPAKLLLDLVLYLSRVLQVLVLCCWAPCRPFGGTLLPHKGNPSRTTTTNQSGEMLQTKQSDPD